MSQSLLSQSTKGKVEKSPLILVYGVDGVGKSSFGAGTKNPYFICAESSRNQFDNATYCPPIQNWDMVLTLIHELLTLPHEHKTIVIDSLDWIEPLVYRKLCAENNVSSIEKVGGGFGKGYTEAFGEWIKLKDMLSKLRDKGLGIILIAHAEVVTFNDPSLQAGYERYQIKLHKKTSALFREFVDVVLFANYASYTKKDGSATRVFGDDARIAYTQRRPGFDAKNRFGLPFQFPFSYQDYEQAKSASSAENPGVIKEEIVGMLPEIKDETIKKWVNDALAKKCTPAFLLEVRNKLLAKLEVQGEPKPVSQ